MRPLLDSSEPDSFELVNATGQGDVVLVCDHASNRIPIQLHTLGLSAQELSSHIAWDLGAFWVARYLSTRLDAPLFFSNYSRLVIDCNRNPEAGDSIPVSSAGIAIPGNQGITPQESLRRRQSLFDPYHAAIDRLLQARAGRASFLLSIHSFTPVLQGVKRPWPLAVCYEEASLWATRWLTALQTQLSAAVGNNEPFQIESDVDYTIPVHVQKHGVPAIMLEIRQDEICNQAAAKNWSEIIGNAWQMISSETPIIE
ncbi:MAG: N-formylglutamate amidohydrolase [Proteobacteria bacterium]|nr:N-formylglutamate amidohydrolase [Pseudomonadota bacterium]